MAKEARIKWTPELRELSKKLHDPYLVKRKKEFRERYGKEPNAGELKQYAKHCLSSSMETWSGFAKELKDQNEINPTRARTEQKKFPYHNIPKRKSI